MESRNIGSVNPAALHSRPSARKAKPGAAMMNITDSVDLKGEQDAPIDMAKAASKIFENRNAKMGVVREFKPHCALDKGQRAAVSSDGKLFLGSDDQSFAALDGKTGQIVWERSLSSGGFDYVPYEAALSPDESKVYYTTQSGKMVALDTKNGKELWEFRGSTSSRISTPAVSSDGKTVYAGSESNDFHAIDADTGLEKWSASVKIGDGSRPALSPDEKTVYVGTGDWRLEALDADTGTTKWDFSLDKRWTRSSPAVGPDGTVYIANCDGKVFAVNPKNGKRKWRTKKMEKSSLSDFTLLPSPDGKRLYASTPYLESGDKKGVVMSLDTRRGRTKWEFDVGSKFHPPVLSRDGMTLYVGSEDGSLYCLDTPTGDVRWKCKTRGKAYSPALSPDESTIYVTSSVYVHKKGEDSELVAIDAKTGKRIQNFKPEGKMRENVAGADDSAYINEELDGHGNKKKPGETTGAAEEDLTIERKGQKVVIGGVELDVREEG